MFSSCAWFEDPSGWSDGFSSFGVHPEGVTQLVVRSCLPGLISQQTGLITPDPANPPLDWDH